MAANRWVLLDENQPAAQAASIDSSDAPGTPPGWSVRRRRLQCGLSQGVDVIEVGTTRLRLVIVPTRGMGLWRAWVDGFELGWQSPVRGPVHPAFVPLAEPRGWGWLDGFDELMCRCGLESFGAPDHDQHGRLLYGLHGRIANRPAHRVDLVIDADAGSLGIHGIVEETRYHHQKLRLHANYNLQFDATQISWNDEVENFGGTPAQLQMMYHVNFGQPLLGEGSQLAAPIARLQPGSAESTGAAARNWSTYAGPTPGFQQQVFYATLRGDAAGDTLVMLKHPDGQRAATLAFNVQQLPCFTQWKNCVAEADGYVTGIEPATGFPDPRSAEEAAGRVLALAPGETWQAAVTLDLLGDASAIENAEQRIAALQGEVPGEILLDMP